MTQETLEKANELMKKHEQYVELECLFECLFEYDDNKETWVLKRDRELAVVENGLKIVMKAKVTEEDITLIRALHKTVATEDCKIMKEFEELK